MIHSEKIIMENQGYRADNKERIPPPSYNNIYNPPQERVVNNVTVINNPPILTPATSTTPIFVAAPVVYRRPLAGFGIFDMMIFNCFHSCLWRKRYERIIDEETGREFKKELPMENENFKKGVSVCIMFSIISLIILGIVLGIIFGVLAAAGTFNSSYTSTTYNTEYDY